MNLTDFDDTFVARAKKNNEDALALSRRFEQAFFEDMKRLHTRPANNYPRASNHVQEMIDMTRGLMQKELTYESDGSIYFDAKKSHNSGRFFPAGRSDRFFLRLLSLSLSKILSTLQSILPAAAKAIYDHGSLVEEAPAFHEHVCITLGARDPYDILLWKRVNEDELGWESPWGRGRPGWHLECSVMSMKYLGPQLDIHGGGEDLIFRHHEREIALSESYTEKRPFVKYWMHTGFLTLKTHKMAKSTGHCMTVRDYLEKHSAESLRLLILTKHRRQRFDLTEDDLINCEEKIKNIYQTHDALNDLVRHFGDREQELEDRTGILEEISRTKTEFLTAMDNDFNTSVALVSFLELIHLGNRILNMETSRKLAETAMNTINELGGILGLFQEQKPVPAQVSVPHAAPPRLKPIPISI